MVLGARCPQDNHWANKRKNANDWRCPVNGYEFSADGIEVTKEDGWKIE
jgi:hypothetical protein